MSEETETSQESSEAVATPDFPEMKTGTQSGGAIADLSRFKDVEVTISAELGRTNMPIEQLLEMGEGTVFTLNRNVAAPIELLAQGIPLGNGEVIVVDDVFAVRIKEIYTRS